MAFVTGRKSSHATSDNTPLEVDLPVATGVFEVGVQAATGAERHIWYGYAVLKVVGGVATLLDAFAPTIDAGDAGLATATMGVTTTSGSLRVTLTGIAATDIDWQINIKQIL